MSSRWSDQGDEGDQVHSEILDSSLQLQDEVGYAGGLPSILQEKEKAAADLLSSFRQAAKKLDAEPPAKRFRHTGAISTGAVECAMSAGAAGAAASLQERRIGDGVAPGDTSCLQLVRFFDEKEPATNKEYIKGDCPGKQQMQHALGWQSQKGEQQERGIPILSLLTRQPYAAQHTHTRTDLSRPAAEHDTMQQ
ncbi:hypothetical protein Efla_000779 [Eimeria flavescens]